MWPEQRPDEECEASEGVYNCWMEGCIVPCTTQMLRVFGTFCIVAMASNTFGNLLSSIGFPAITVFLAFGVRRAIRPRNSAQFCAILQRPLGASQVLAGPFGFDLVTREDAPLIKWINDVALGFIGLSAGGKFMLETLLSNLRPVLSVLTGLVCVTYIGSITVTLSIGDYFIPFMSQLSFTEKFAASLLIACLAVARSPSSAIAIIQEMNAEGPFTTVVLAVTVMMDVVVVVLFALTMLIAQALNPNPNANAAHHHSGSPLVVLLSFGIQVALSGVLGFVLGRVLPVCLGCVPAAKKWGSRPGLCALIGGVIFSSFRMILFVLQRFVLMFTGWVLFFDEQLSEQARNSGAIRRNAAQLWRNSGAIMTPHCLSPSSSAFSSGRTR